MADIVAVTLLRHGVTQANLEKRYLGWTDIPIIEEAKRKLQESKIFGEQFDLCITSDLLRAKQTAEILCPRLELIKKPAFREMNFGAWEMKTYEDLKGNLDYRNWIDNPKLVTPPGGEEFLEMAARVDAGFQRLRQETMERGSKNILLVTHGGVIRYLLATRTKEAKDFFDWNISHDSGMRLVWEIEAWKEGHKCTLLQEVPLTARENG